MSNQKQEVNSNQKSLNKIFRIKLGKTRRNVKKITWKNLKIKLSQKGKNYLIDLMKEIFIIDSLWLIY